MNVIVTLGVLSPELGLAGLAILALLLVGPLVLGSGELRMLRVQIDTAVYSSANREVTLRSGSFDGATSLVDAIVAARQAA